MMVEKSVFRAEMENILSGKTLWERLQSESRPIVLYGMGDGAEKIFSVCKERGIPVSGVMASDAFVRGQSFLGYPVRTLAATEEALGECVYLLSFGSSLPDVMAHIDAVRETHTLYAPDVPLFGGGIWDRECLTENLDRLEQVYSLLGDDLSKKVFTSVISYRMTGNLSYLSRCETPREEMYTLLGVGENEDYLDLGAYDGDTLREFLSETGGSYGSLTAVEPDPKSRRKLLERMEKAYPGITSDPRFTLIEGGVWSEEGTLSFDNAAGRNSSLSEGGKLSVNVFSVDGIRQGKGCSFIKMDVEGSEREALIGAGKTLSGLRPKLIFSAYHRTEDLFALPELLRKLAPEYKLFLRHQPYYPAWEVNFCAKAE